MSDELFRLDGFAYRRCSRCGLITTDPRPSAEEIVAYYADHARSGTYSADIEAFADLRAGVFRSYLRAFERETGQTLQKQVVLDVGCLTGVSLSAIAEQGGEPFGVEMQEWAAAVAEQTFPGRVQRGNICTDELSSPRPHLVVMSDVLEHLDEPASALQRVARHLLPGGYLLITTPDATSLLARLLGRNWPSYVPIHHIWLWNSSNIRVFLSESGFETVRVRPLFKRYSAEYIRRVLRDLKPALAPFLDAIPAFLARTPVPVNGGEMLVLARLRPSSGQ